MRLSSQRRIHLTGGLLVLLVLATRWLFMSRTPFEFDSIDFIVATFRFNLEQVTPHMPGYILHILLGRFFHLFFDFNDAFVWISIILSVGSTLFLWRAAYHLRGERVALIVAAIWLTHPFFWFYGEVATVYAYESFFASALLMLGIGLVRNPVAAWRPIAIGVTLSLAAGARQSSLLFFAPAIIYLFWISKQPTRIWIRSLFAFVVVTAIWGFELVRESGGLSTYLHFAGLEHIYRTQSVLFGNPLREHLAIVSKIFIYLIAGSLPLMLAVFVSFLFFFRWTKEFIGVALRSRAFKFSFLIAIVPLLFYIFVYFMKAGYLLNVWPSVILAAGVTVDQLAIMLARRTKERSTDRMLLTRPLITRAGIVMTSCVVVYQIIWFVVPLPGKDYPTFNDANTQDSFSESLAKRYEGSNNTELVLNRIFGFSSSRAVHATDVMNSWVGAGLYRAADSADHSHTVSATLLATWWSRQAYLLESDMHVYDIRTSSSQKMQVGLSKDLIRKPITDSVIRLPHEPTYLLIRADHPDLLAIAGQVRLQKYFMPKYLDLYKITDTTFSFVWDGVRFVKD